MRAVFALDTCVDLLAVPALVSAGLAPARPTLHVSFEHYTRVQTDANHVGASQSERSLNIKIIKHVVNNRTLN